MIIRSLLTENNPFNSTQELKDWIEKRNREVTVHVEQVPFSKLEKWYCKDDGSIHHESGRFFSIVGIDVQTDYGINNHWRQPIINQPEVGYLGILTKEIDPGLKTPTSSLYILSNFPAMVMIAPLLLLLGFAGKSLSNAIITCAIFFVLWMVYSIFLFRRRIFKKYYKDKPVVVWKDEE